MADNYLEKKMEELHNRKSGCAPTRVSPASRHLLTFPFKPLRVLVISRDRHALSQYTNPFQQAGCRVAVVSTIDAGETDLPQDHGCRYYAIGNAARPSPNDWGFPVLSVSQNRITRHDILTDAAISSPVPDVSDRPESTVLTFLALKSSAPISSITF